ncbi:putative ABC transport system permease protein [Clostridium collagenovorans DSM 3089]|uniref:Putative ABC transport system permease protein n=1 Tax=Clostridium collagenovorans DSM 3089 TaxID=1121306 RepID=A0A1M5XGT1_9CLOT|nr:ABC transporter permease [Clostridium collagenovorans]SHH98842.1 putative ABC transport system permease protein [Clostridium collagenovorans DSM 3089]
MSFINLIKTSIHNLKSHKLRVMLTMIGIIIGISSVVTILSIGNGLKEKVTSSSEDVNANKVCMSYEPENMNVDISLVEFLNENDIRDLGKIKGVEKAERVKQNLAGINLTTMELKYFDKKAVVFLDTYKDSKLNILHGRGFKNSEKGRNVVVLNFDAAKQLFDVPEEGIGKAIDIGGSQYEVVGILNEAKDMFAAFDSSYVFKDDFAEVKNNEPIYGIDVTIKPDADKDKIIEEMKTKLKENHSDLKGKYTVEDPQQVTKVFEELIGGVTAFIAFVSGISLLVGGIGVMNIMYVSVSERKREIGIRRAIGAKQNSILLQFLLESAIVTGIGGLIGILMGYLFAKLAGVFLPFEPVMTVGSFVGATLTSIIVGVVFGMIPAYNASKLDPIKAIYR